MRKVVSAARLTEEPGGVPGERGDIASSSCSRLFCFTYVGCSHSKYYRYTYTFHRVIFYVFIFSTHWDGSESDPTSSHSDASARALARHCHRYDLMKGRQATRNRFGPFDIDVDVHSAYWAHDATA